MRHAAGAALLVLALGVLGTAQAQQRVTATHGQHYVESKVKLIDALRRYTDLVTKHNVPVIGFFPGGNGGPGLTTCAKGAQREAAVKFPKFITQEDMHRLRLQQTGNPGRPPSCPYWPCSWCCIDRS
ncbi:MAG TPA: hypothetical protein VNA86_15065 [bacterium]|nr:hypothetical protein [bacterium]